MFMMTSQISKRVDFTKTQKSKNLENETLFFLQIKKIINYTSSAALLQTTSHEQLSLLSPTLTAYKKCVA